eukprot:TRINITY_DN3920_c0_g1_i1.p1 TRINITY_DN3920_c0_g1~~TRINITY_DN3920_c0_g1_i1.p1  ORF type:complete len:259 (-),score=42.63 TRINITY_DN3920_c0_g1_i1:121-897(-)
MFILFIFCTIQFWFINNLTKLVTCLHCLGIFGLRAISLILAAYLYNIPAVVDFPTFAFFSVVFWFASVWYTVVRPILLQDVSLKFSMKVVFSVWLPVAIPLFLFYAAIMIVNGTVDKDVSLITKCYGLISLGTPQWSTMQVLSFVYRLILMLIAVIMGLSLTIYGFYIQKEVKGSSIEAKAKEITTLLTVHSIFFPIHCLVLICFETTGYHNIAAGLTILLVVEIVPGLVILGLSMNPLSWTEGLGALTNTRSTGSTK